MVTRKDYQKNEVEICLSVLVEILTILGRFRESIVLIGGWVPYFLLEERGDDHIGSIDIDLALDFTKISDNNYRTILSLLEKHDYTQGNQPYIFLKKVISDGIQYNIEIDLLSGEYGGTGKSHRTQKFQDIRLRKARGCDLSFEHNVKRKISNLMPDGSRNEVEITISGVVPFLIMKGMALWDRYNPKDAYDIYFTISNYPGHIQSLIEAFQPLVSNNLVIEGLGKIKAKFKTIDSPGPVWLVNFLEIHDPDERALTLRDAYERINYFLDSLNIEEFT
jgi:hypothetical protein